MNALLFTRSVIPGLVATCSAKYYAGYPVHMGIRHAKRSSGLKKTEIWIIWTVSTGGNCNYLL